MLDKVGNMLCYARLILETDSSFIRKLLLNNKINYTNLISWTHILVNQVEDHKHLSTNLLDITPGGVECGTKLGVITIHPFEKISSLNSFFWHLASSLTHV